jgi:hypothetical protein
VPDNGYQFKISPLREGRHSWRVCPLPDAQDDEGQYVTVGPSPCTEGTFEVLK